MDIIPAICLILIGASIVVALTVGYIWYLDRLWAVQIYRAQKEYHRPIKWEVVDKKGNIVA